MKALYLAAVVGLVLATNICRAVDYSGSLSTSDAPPGVWVTADWTPIRVNWTVSEVAPGIWHYEYVLTCGKRSFSHWLLETSDTFSASNLWNLTGNCTFRPNEDIGTWNPGPGNPSLPGPLYGIKFTPMGGSPQIVRVAFDSDRGPVWGDFYAKDGTGYYAWNTGFTNPDTDPLAPPGDGALDYHLLVPDTVGTTDIPEPGAIALMGTAMGVLALARRRKRR